MHKKAMIFVITAIIIIAAILVCVIPRFTGVDATLQATKFNNRGESVGAHDIVLSGNRLDYLFSDTALELSVSAFDILRDFVVETELKTASGGEMFYVLYSAVNTAKDDVDVIRVGFSPDMDRWVFVNDTDQVYYVASVSGDYSAEELVEYFRPLIPANWR